MSVPVTRFNESGSIAGGSSAVAPAKNCGNRGTLIGNPPCGLGRQPERSDGDPDLALQGDERWYLVHTLPNGEFKAQMHLRMQGFRTYLPLHLKTIRHARQLRTVKVGLFPRYLFVVVDVGRDRWLSIRSTAGVACLVGCEDRPIPVPPGIVESLIAGTDEANLALSGDDLKKGQKVRLASGPFADFVGTLDRLDEAGRVRVLLHTMGSPIVVKLHRAGILPAA